MVPGPVKRGENKQNPTNHTSIKARERESMQRGIHKTPTAPHSEATQEPPISGQPFRDLKMQLFSWMYKLLKGFPPVEWLEVNEENR